MDWLESANTSVAESNRRLLGYFIFEVADSGREAAVGSHVGVADESKVQLEIECFGESLLLKDPGAHHLAGNGCQDFILARGQNVDSRNLRLLVKVLGAEFDG